MVQSPNDEFPMTNRKPARNSTIEARTPNFPRFANRNSQFGLRHVRHSNFVIRHCPAPHDATGRFDFVLANPPFNVNAVDAANCEVRSLKCEGRSVRQSTFDIRHSRRLWIQLFHSALNEKGRAGFVMANSASDARSSEQELRRQLIESRAVDVMVAVGTNTFYTIAHLRTRWSLHNGKLDRNPVLPRHVQPPDAVSAGAWRSCPGTGRCGGDRPF